MRVRCSASPDYRSNAVGCLELDTSADALLVALRGVSSHREGYAPGPPVHSSDLAVPWHAVYATRIGPDALLLTLDGRRLAQNRYLLREFADAPEPGRGRALAAARALVLPAAALALGVWLLWPDPLELLRSPPVAALLAALLWVNGVALLVRRAWARRRRPRAVLDELCQELALHLPHQVAAEPAAEPPRIPTARRLGRLLPRSAVGLAVSLAAASLAALVSGTAALPRERGGPGSAGREPEARAEKGESGEPSAAHGAEPQPAEEAAPACACERHESLLWAEPPPRLSVLVLGARVETHEGHAHTELELGLVNNGDRPIERPEVAVSFHEARADGLPGQRRSAERSLRLDSTLAPGGLLRARLEARGTGFDVLAPDLGALHADGHDAAPSEQVERLLREPSRPLGLHAARLLAFMRDPGAAAAARALRDGATADEAAFLDGLLAPEPPVAACDAEVWRERAGLWRVGVCLHNRSAEARRVPVRLLAFDAAVDGQRPGGPLPALLGAEAAGPPLELGAGAGQRVELRAPLVLAAGAVPRAFEVRAAPEEPAR